MRSQKRRNLQTVNRRRAERQKRRDFREAALAAWHDEFVKARGAKDMQMAWEGAPAPFCRADWQRLFIAVISQLNAAGLEGDFESFVAGFAVRNSAVVFTYEHGRLRVSSDSEGTARPNAPEHICAVHSGEIAVQTAYREMSGRPGIPFAESSAAAKRAAMTFRALLAPGFADKFYATVSRTHEELTASLQRQIDKRLALDAERGSPT